MNIFLTGRNLDSIRQELTDAGFPITDSADQADLIVTYGGDGTLLGAEHDYPGKMKFPIRDCEAAPHCPEHSTEKLIEALRSGTLKTTFLPKICGCANGRSLKAINDVFIHNRNYVSAMRYIVWIDGERYGNEVVGDGVGLSTVHGSTAYYRSITHSIFRTGIGLAFSNSTELVNHLVLPETSVIRVRILRGPCEMVADNSSERIEMNEGDDGVIRLCPEQAPMLGLDAFMCPECRLLRHNLRHSTQNG